MTSAARLRPPQRRGLSHLTPPGGAAAAARRGGAAARYGAIPGPSSPLDPVLTRAAPARPRPPPRGRGEAGRALDAHNAPSVLLLARELSLASLEGEAMTFLLVEIEAVEQCDTNFWDDLPPRTRETLRALREATLRNPLLSPTAAPARLAASRASGDARELLGMVSSHRPAQPARPSKLWRPPTSVGLTHRPLPPLRPAACLR